MEDDFLKRIEDQLTGFNPSGSMDYFGSFPWLLLRPLPPSFQSFWFNGLLWKAAWLTGRELISYCFNPSGSMDYFGSPRPVVSAFVVTWFQSFWFNGLLWKIMFFYASAIQNLVSILLVQWITLEVLSLAAIARMMKGFNPSGSMDYFGRRGFAGCHYMCSAVSILLVQWITLEGAVGC